MLNKSRGPVNSLGVAGLFIASMSVWSMLASLFCFCSWWLACRYQTNSVIGRADVKQP